MKHVVRPDAVMVRGKGSYLWDRDGRKYLDFVQGWAVNVLGHAPAQVASAICDQATTLITASPAYHNALELQLAHEISRLSRLPRVFFASSGAEANEGAIKLCRKWGRLHRGGAYEIVTTQGGFHGRTLSTMAATGKPGWDALFPPAVPGFVKVPFGDVAAVRGAIGKNTVAIMVEPIQGEGGVIVPPPGYLAEIRGIADEAGVLLVLDEIQTGMGRTGTLFAYQQDEIVPDVLTLGKGLGGGVPLSALVASERASCFEPGDQGGTFSGNPLAMSAGIAVVAALTTTGFLDAVRARGNALTDGLRSLSASGIAEVRGRGLLVAARLQAQRATEVRDRAFELGLLVNAPRPDTLRFMPALNVSDAEIEEMLSLLGRAL